MPHSTSPTPRLLLALDTGSPVVSVAVGNRGLVLAERSLELSRSSGALLSLVDETLKAAGVTLQSLEGLLGLRGPGSFTGLRVGLATLQGLHEALGIPATAIPTFDALAALSPGDGAQTLAAVDARRDEWFVQPLRADRPVRPLALPRRIGLVELVSLAPQRLIGFGVSRLVAAFDPEAVPALIEPDGLAGAALHSVEARPPGWDPRLLAAPLYLRRPAVTPLCKAPG